MLILHGYYKEETREKPDMAIGGRRTKMGTPCRRIGVRHCRDIWDYYVVRVNRHDQRDDDAARPHPGVSKQIRNPLEEISMKKTIRPAGLFAAATFALCTAVASFPLQAADNAPAPNKLIPVDVSLGDVSINKVPFLIAADAGIYAKNGLEVHQYITPTAAAAARESGVIVPPEYINANIGEAPIVVGGGSPTIYRYINKINPTLHVIVSTTETIVRDHVIAIPSVNSMQDLKGKRIGYTAPGTVTNYDALAFVQKMGWQPGKDVTMVDKASSLSAIKDGRTDAIVGSAMEVALAQKENLKDLGSLASYNMPLAGSGVMVKKPWLDANRDTTARFVKATVQATALMKSDKKVFAAALAKWFNITDPQTQDLMFAAVKEFPAKPYPAVDGIKGVMAMYDSPAMREHQAEEFYDNSFIADLDKSGYLDKLNK
jgi:NitT/TauT family transport system substrate-binding protein